MNSTSSTSQTCPTSLTKKNPENTKTLIKSDTSLSGKVKIELLKGGSTNKVLANAAPNNGAYDWKITTEFPPGNDYKIKITSLENTSVIGQSGSNFTIKEEIILKLPYVQNFDKWIAAPIDMDNWVQATDDDFDWIIQKGPTPSRIADPPDKTGAESDHTSGSGKYIYVEASNPNYPNKKTAIITPKFDFTTLKKPSMIFYYHMFSADNQMGSFYVDVKVGENEWKEKIAELSGDQGDAWKFKIIDLSSITQNNGRVQFRFRGITGSSWQGDICIDDFRIDEDITAVKNPYIKSSLVPTLRYNKSKIYYIIPGFQELYHVTLKLYNINGKLIRTFVNTEQASGKYSIAIKNLQTISKGVYFCKFETAGLKNTIKIMNK